MNNTMKRLMRKGRGFRKDEGGVSEILGDILLVSVVIVVMASIAAQVVDVQKPASSKTTDFSARLEGNDMVVTHMGGRTLQNPWTLILVGVGPTPNKQLKIADGFNTTHPSWRIGEEWRVNVSSEKTSATANGASLWVQIIDTKNNQILFDQILISGTQNQAFPDVGFQPGSLTFSASRPNSGDPEIITVKVVNLGTVDVDNLIVRFYDDTTLIGTNSTILLLNRSGQPGYIQTVTLNWVTSYLGRHVINAKVVPKINETNLANNYISARLNVGFGVNLDFTKPNLVVTDFTISKERPMSKETTLLKATIANTARIQAIGFNLTWGDDAEGVNTTLGTTTYAGNVTYVNSIVQTYVWVPQMGGLHHVWVHITAVFPNGEDSKAEADPVLDADWGLMDITVMPRILLVDDDMAGKGTSKDTITYMKESLKANGIQFDQVNVGAGDGPLYNGTGIVLSNYDIVIWMTGYESTNTITTTGSSPDIKNLKDYLDNKGSLWLIGQDVTNDLWNNGGASGRAFLKDYLHVNSQTLDVALGTSIKGNNACPPVKGMDLNTSVPSGLTASPDLIAPDVNSRAALDNQTNQNISLVYNKSTYKVAFFAFEFSQIKSSAERAILTYKMLIWFNVTVFFDGDDLAVSEVSISPVSPHYKQEVTITATIRNNGIHNLNNVKLVFKDVYMGIETIITPNIKDRAGGKQVYDNPMNLNLSALGDQNLTVKYWVPEKIGAHLIRVVVDPNNIISEIDEDNNEFVSDLTSTNVYVDSITLVVDDDQNTGNAKNTTSSIVSALNTLNYKHVAWKVPNAASNGPDLANMSKYNNIVWCFGNESTIGTTFTATDTTNLQTYLTGYQGNLWVIGQNFLEDNGVRNNVTFRRNLLGINAMNRDITTPSTLIGINDNLTHGMRFAEANTFGNNHESDSLTPQTGAQYLFKNSAGQNFGTAFYNTSGVSYKTVVMTTEFSFISDTQDRLELAYLIFHWFGQSDTRIELRVTYDDLYFARDNGKPQAFDLVKPVLGSSYILQVKVWNVGNTPTGAIVRFLDGNTVINSASIYIPASTLDPTGNLVIGSELAEVIWSPLYAGNRPITIKVDPDKNIPVVTDPKSTVGEIMKKNNNITRNIDVYFFYDDLENNAVNWTHEATLMRINGEQAIEYFDSLRPVDTNVVSKWNNKTGSWTQLFDNGHTLPSSYRSTEPNDIGNYTIHLRVGICIEDSAAIENLDPTHVRVNASWEFMNTTLGTGDQFTVYWDGSPTTNLFKSEFPSAGDFEDSPFENTSRYVNVTNGYFGKKSNSDVASCIRMGTTDLKNSWATPGIYPALIVLTSLQNYGGNGPITQMMDDSRQSGIPIYMLGVGVEPQLKSELLYDIAMVSNGGLYFQAANGAGIASALSVIGEIIGSGGSRSITDSSSDYDTGSRGDIDSRTTAPSQGNGNSRVTLYNPVGTDKWAQGVSRNISWFCGTTYTAAQCGNPAISFDPGTGVFTAISPISTTKSPYDWTSDSSTFAAKARVWQYNWTVPKVVCNNCRIRVDIAGGTRVVTSANFQIFNSGLPLGVKHAVSMSNITTDTINTANYKKLTLGFWHKYDLLTAENGGVLLVGNSSLPNSGFKYSYVYPVHSYPGNLRTDKVVKDDYGLRMLFAYNGRSAGQTFEWTYDEADLSRFISSATPYIRVRFALFAWGYGNGGGWYIDDVTVRASRSDTTAITANIADQWQYYQWQSGVDSPFLQPHSGTHMWWNHNPSAANDLKSGIDNSLMTKPINLLNARDATLSAYFMFNLKDTAGRPPDGFRVEISSDNAVTWRPINLGVRSGWGVSGQWSVDGKSPDLTQAYTGIQDSGVDSATPTWVKSGSMWRLNTNLSGWTGKVIQIRFRVVTNLDPTHYQSNTVFKGVAVDDVMVRGNTTVAKAPAFKHDSSKDWLKPEGQDNPDVAGQHPNSKITAQKAAVTAALPTQSKSDEGDS